MKDGGLAALTEAERRADQATYQEVRCRSALNKVDGMPFSWTLNPYRGCTHDCQYCFARRYQSQLELDAGDQFASVIFVKANLVAVLRRELDRPAWTRDLVAVGTATDPYQPIEGHYRLTRGALEVLADARTPVAIVTKGPMIVRDRDVLQAFAGRARCAVHFSVPTVDEDAWRALEPGTAHPLQRLRAARTLADAGIETGVLIAPMVPGFTTAPRKLEATIKAVADHGITSIGTMLLHLDGGTRDHFLGFLAREFPALTHRYEQLYASKYAPKDYQARVAEVVGLLKARYGVDRPRWRKDDAAAPGLPAATAAKPQPAQRTLRYDT